MTIIKLKRAASDGWLLVNPVLADGEPGFEEDTGHLKIGDGSTFWTDLPYYITKEEQDSTYVSMSGSVWSTVAADPTATAGFIAGLPGGTAYLVTQASPFDILQGIA